MRFFAILSALLVVHTGTKICSEVMVHGFIPSPQSFHGPLFVHLPGSVFSRSSDNWKMLHTQFALSPSTLSTDDPYQILHLERNSNLTKKDIKQAYKCMASKHHPDVIISQNSTPEEKGKANADFVKINSAYEALLGQASDSQLESTSFGSTKGRVATREGGYPRAPPPRRSKDWFQGTSFGSRYKARYKHYGSEHVEHQKEQTQHIGDKRHHTAMPPNNRGGSDFDIFWKKRQNNQHHPAENIIWAKTYRSSGNLLEDMDHAESLVNELSREANGIHEGLMYARTKGLGDDKAHQMQAQQKTVDDNLHKARQKLDRLQQRFWELRSEGNV